MQLSFSLLLKLTAAITSGAAVLLTLRRLRQDESISSFRRDISATAGLMMSPSPPTILIVGVRGHGKSSFLNTACRALANEYGPLLLRAESKPPAGETSEKRLVVQAAVDPGGEQIVEEDVSVAFVEKGIGLEATKEDIEAVVGGSNGVECVVMVIRCSGPTRERSLVIRKLPEISAPVRELG
jgi:septin family protein